MRLLAANVPTVGAGLRSSQSLVALEPQGSAGWRLTVRRNGRCRGARLELSTLIESGAERQLVGQVEVAADRQAAGES
jgi:hypothetical protein